jgi:hypothetical protein
MIAAAGRDDQVPLLKGRSWEQLVVEDNAKQ